MNFENKVYRAEDWVFRNHPNLKEKEVFEYFQEVISSKEYPYNPVKLYICGPAAWGNKSVAFSGEIYLLEGAHFKKYIILHEIAHAVKRPAKNPHGKAWQKRYVDLVEKFLDRDGASELRLAFQKLP